MRRQAAEQKRRRLRAPLNIAIPARSAGATFVLVLYVLDLSSAQRARGKRHRWPPSTGLGPGLPSETWEQLIRPTQQPREESKKLVSEIKPNIPHTLTPLPGPRPQVPLRDGTSDGHGHTHTLKKKKKGTLLLAAKVALRGEGATGPLDDDAGRVVARLDAVRQGLALHELGEEAADEGVAGAWLVGWWVGGLVGCVLWCVVRGEERRGGPEEGGKGGCGLRPHPWRNESNRIAPATHRWCRRASPSPASPPGRCAPSPPTPPPSPPRPVGVAWSFRGWWDGMG